MLNDHICGSGTMKYFNGDEYTGEWVNELVLHFYCELNDNFLIRRMLIGRKLPKAVLP